ncbi:amino acid/amide ABC transporter membrane protein 1, HAAT family [Halogeometricum rufum]|jgi:branched-chain amino acid transport system permease protein|uniref:Amino acid/amide ABC transporter membrane protein 1, HAAT family n=1 Tax=Halogeometricum rufum TaxID=553469 RepID=A0A1I6GHK6_9EURY|nr:MULTISPECIES: branched-chain amino acid ABC transporter permease [Halogeometricum]MUV57565.1 branched-chain amino acid ABC transporter permease [Halogeometricum sp. CBA1124]SFR41654.1 amino acid/amide ABC transporter membrane protein 1, HAAT family [Halogeometricum rufum]
MSVVSQLATILLNGLQQGAIYVLLAVGLSIILGTLKFVNFAHGALYLIGTYAGLFIALDITLSSGKLQEWGYADFGLGWGFLAALVLVPLFVFAIGLLMERFLARPFYDRPDTDQILVTFGLAIVVQELFRILFGSNSLPFNQPEYILSVIPVSGPMQLPIVGNFPRWRLWVIGITAVLVGIVYLLVEHTDFGLVVRAGTRDAEMVRLLGIKISRPYLVVFGIGAALAGVAGVVGGPLNVVNPTVGMNILVPAFLTVVIGGVGTIAGAVVGGLIIGLVQATLIGLPSVTIASFTLNFSPWSQVGLYAIAAIILLVRPQGILGDEEVAP